MNFDNDFISNVMKIKNPAQWNPCNHKFRSLDFRYTECHRRNGPNFGRV